MISDGSLLRSGGETWGPVSPDNVHETGVSLHRDRQGGAVRGNAKKDLVKLAIRGFCAPQGLGLLDDHVRHCLIGGHGGPTDPDEQAQELMGAVGRMVSR